MMLLAMHTHNFTIPLDLTRLAILQRGAGGSGDSCYSNTAQVEAYFSLICKVGDLTLGHGYWSGRK